MRKRITIKGIMVSSSGDTDSILSHSPTIRHHKKKVVIPQNYGNATYNTFLGILKGLHPKDWEKRLNEASIEIDKAFNKGCVRVIGSATRTVRKGYTTQVLR